MISQELLNKITGSTLRGTLLQNFIFWTTKLHDYQKFLSENKYLKENPHITPTFKHGWIYKGCGILQKDLKSLAPTRMTIFNNLKILLQQNYLIKHSTRKSSQGSTYYRVNLNKIEEDILLVSKNSQLYTSTHPLEHSESALPANYTPNYTSYNKEYPYFFTIPKLYTRDISILSKKNIYINIYTKRKFSLPPNKTFHVSEKKIKFNIDPLTEKKMIDKPTLECPLNVEITLVDSKKPSSTHNAPQKESNADGEKKKAPRKEDGSKRPNAVLRKHPDGTLLFEEFPTLFTEDGLLNANWWNALLDCEEWALIAYHAGIHLEHIHRVFEEFFDYYSDGGGRKTRRKKWVMAWRVWCNKTVGWGQYVKSHTEHAVSLTQNTFKQYIENKNAEKLQKVIDSDANNVISLKKHTEDKLLLEVSNHINSVNETEECKAIRREVVRDHGTAAYVSWFQQIALSLDTTGRVQVKADNKFVEQTILNKFNLRFKK